MSDTQKHTVQWVGGVEPAAELLQATGTQILELECRQQPERLRALLESYGSDPEIAAQLARFRALSHAPGPVLFIGMGASYCSALSGVAHLQSHGRLAFAVDAGEWLQFAEPVWAQAGLSMLLTTSGESAELVALLRGEHERAVGLICGNPASTCWGLAVNRLPILAGPEYGNATKSYTNATAASIIVASSMLGQDWRGDALHAADVFAANLDRIFAMRGELDAFCRDAKNIEIVGRGAGYGGAFMSALCIREMSGVRAAPHTGAGFRHGPNLDVDASHVAIIFALGHTAALGVKLAQECNRRGGKVLLVSEEEHAATPSLLPVRIPPVAEPWEGITSLLVPQALTLAIVERSGCRLPPRFQYGVMEQ